MRYASCLFVPLFSFPFFAHSPRTSRMLSVVQKASILFSPSHSIIFERSSPVMMISSCIFFSWLYPPITSCIVTPLLIVLTAYSRIFSYSLDIMSTRAFECMSSMKRLRISPLSHVPMSPIITRFTGFMEKAVQQIAPPDMVTAVPRFRPVYLFRIFARMSRPPVAEQDAL